MRNLLDFEIVHVSHKTWLKARSTLLSPVATLT